MFVLEGSAIGALI